MPTIYPGSLDTTTSLSTAVNGLSTPLNGDHTSSATTITVASTSGAASAGYVYVDSEVIKYAGLTPTTLTGCTRGADGTAAAQHSNGATVKFALVADHHNSLVSAVIALQNKVGLNTNGASASSIDGNQLAASTVPNAALIDSSILMRRLRLENNVTRVRSAQNPGAIAVTASVWSNVGTAVVITPAVPSYIMAWAWLGGSMNVNTSDYLKFQFNGGNGELGSFALGMRDDALGQRTITAFDTLLQVGAGAVSMQVQLTTNNNGTFSPFNMQGGFSFSVFALAIPSN